MITPSPEDVRIWADLLSRATDAPGDDMILPFGLNPAASSVYLFLDTRARFGLPSAAYVAMTTGSTLRALKAFESENEARTTFAATRDAATMAERLAAKLARNDMGSA